MTDIRGKLVRVESPYFTAGLVLDQDLGARVLIAAPILKYMKGWHIGRVQTYCKSKGWECVIL